MIVWEEASLFNSSLPSPPYLCRYSSMRLIASDIYLKLSGQNKIITNAVVDKAYSANIAPVCSFT